MWWSTGVTVGELIKDESKLNVIEIDLAAQHSDDLTRNLSGLNLAMDKVSKDGNCLFQGCRHTTSEKKHC